MNKREFLGAALADGKPQALRGRSFWTY